MIPPFLYEGLTIQKKLLHEKITETCPPNASDPEKLQLAGTITAQFSIDHPDYTRLAGRISAYLLQQEVPSSFSEAMKNASLNPLTRKVIEKHSHCLNQAIVPSRDFQFNIFGIQTLRRAYLLKHNGKYIETPQYMWMRVSVGIHGEDLESVFETYHAMSLGFLTHATPTLFNCGTKKPQCSSCFLIAMKDDSINGIFDTVKECALISKNAGGIGLHLHNIRAKGSAIKGTGGVSNGLVPMLRVFNNTARYCDQGGGKRMGSFAMYLNPWHADIFSFLDLKKNHGAEELRARDLFYALWIPDLFMKRVEEDAMWTLFCPNEALGLADTWGEAFESLYLQYEKDGIGRKTFPARRLWKKIIDTQIETGTPYLLYADPCNAKSNQQNLGTIQSSNLCVAPETRILTKRGWFRIDQLSGKTIPVWNGEAFSDAKIVQTGSNQPLRKVILDNGTEMFCTPYHKFFIQTTYSSKKPTKVDAKDLQKGMKLIKCSYPVIDGMEEFAYAYTHGLFCADGTYQKGSGGLRRCSFKASERGLCVRHQKYPHLYSPSNEQCCAQSGQDKPSIALYAEKQELLPQYRTTTSPTHDKCVATLPLEMAEKFIVPINSSIDNKIRWLEGYLDGDGCVCRNGFGIQAVSIHESFLHDIMLLLQTLGIHATVKKAKKANKRLLPNGHGGLSMYDCKETFRLQIASAGVQQLIHLGFSPHRIQPRKYKPQRSATHFVKVVSSETTNRRSDTYCFKEEKRGMGMFEGVLTSNCAEIVQYSSAEETAVCNLASIALSRCVINGSFSFNQLELSTRILVRNLNRIIDINFYPTETTRVSNRKHRPIGIGVQGLADVFQLLFIPFDSDQAAVLNRNIFETLYYAACDESCRLAQAEGPYSSFQGSPASKGLLQFDLWKKSALRLDWEGLKQRIQQHGLRNSLLTAIMPTASTSQILGNNECCEPFTSNLYVRRVLSGEFYMMNKHLVRVLEQQGLWCENLKEQLIKHRGSVQNIPGIPKEVKDVFKTVWELKQKVLIDMASDRGPFIDQSQSLNLFITSPSYGMLTSMHFYAWKKGLKTGMYYLRTKPAVDAIAFSLSLPVKSPGTTQEPLVCKRKADCLSCGS